MIDAKAEPLLGRSELARDERVYSSLDCVMEVQDVIAHASDLLVAFFEQV
jgi:hypothetical protein